MSKRRTRLRDSKIKISWGGQKRCYNNILIERLWRTDKSEEVYLHAYSDGWEAEISLARFFWGQGEIPLTKPNDRKPAKGYADRLLGGPGGRQEEQ